MLSDRDIELAHPEAFDFAFGNLPRDKRAEFNRHLSGCRYCRSVVGEYGGIGAAVKNLPPPAEPSASLEPRTVAAMVAVLAGQRAKPAGRPADASAGDDATRPYRFRRYIAQPSPRPRFSHDRSARPPPNRKPRSSWLPS